VQTYFLRRTLQAIPILFILSMVLFGLVRLAPGGPLAQAERNPNISPQQLARLREKLGLDQPLPVQYARWLGQILLEGDLGNSIKFRRPVSEMIQERLFNTFVLVGASFVVTLLLAIPVGVISANRQYSTFDYMITAFTFIGQSIPAYWLGLVLIVLFYLVLSNPVTGDPLLPASGMYSIGQEGEFLNLLWHLVLPVATLSLASLAWYSRFLRSSMLDVLHEDYIRTARSKGLAERLVRYRHALGNAILPLVTIVSLDLPTLFSGALFVETIFSWPGMGRLFWDAARGRDYPVLLGVVMLNAALIVICNLLADLLYGWLDPRIHYE
jgi:peptide/nickel transport system permease protein